MNSCFVNDLPRKPCRTRNLTPRMGMDAGLATSAGPSLRCYDVDGGTNVEEEGKGKDNWGDVGLFRDLRVDKSIDFNMDTWYATRFPCHGIFI